MKKLLATLMILGSIVSIGFVQGKELIKIDEEKSSNSSVMNESSTKPNK